MNRIVKKVIWFVKDEHGPTAIEYAMLLGLIFLVVLTAITAVGQATGASFEYSRDSIGEAFDARG